jgi:hypothetical protein
MFSMLGFVGLSKKWVLFDTATAECELKSYNLRQALGKSIIC